MKYALLIFISLVGHSLFAQEVIYQPVPIAYHYPVIVYQPIMMQQVRMVPVVENKVTYVPVQTVPVQPQGYWVHDRGWLLCKERWRYVPYNY